MTVSVNSIRNYIRSIQGVLPVNSTNEAVSKDIQSWITD